MGKKEPEISKWINGVQNFTLKTLSKLEAALGQEIITVPCKRNHVTELKEIQVLRRHGSFASRQPLQARPKAVFRSWTSYLSPGLVFGGLDIEPNKTIVSTKTYAGTGGTHHAIEQWVTIQEADLSYDNKFRLTKSGV
jgi:hypothetical protein